MIILEEKKEQVATIKVVGIGGAGGNTVNSIIDAGCEGVQFIAVNTDSQALALSKAGEKIQIGIKSTKGLGTGANPELGKRSAEEDLDKILEMVADADIVFLNAGMGGGTGSGAAPVIAHALREKGILSIAVVTKPFLFEGKRRAKVAEDAINALRKEVDTLIVIPNQNLLDVVDANVSMIDAFSMINDVLSQSVKGISDIITKAGHINVDFSDVRVIMKDMGIAVMGTGRSSGEGRARKAAIDAISSPLLENMSVTGARGVLINISGGKCLSLHEISEAASVIYEQAHEDANIILGSVIDESLGDEVTVTIIATGFECNIEEMRGYKTVSVREDAAQTVEHTELHIIKDVVMQEKPEEKEEVIEAAAEEAYEEEEMEAAERELIDPNDLDVPTYLRKEVQETQSESTE